MRAPRFRLRTLMILVALVGVALGCTLELRRRRARFELLSALATIKANNASRRVVGSTVFLRIDRETMLSIDRYAQPGDCRSAYHKGIARKYREAARVP